MKTATPILFLAALALGIAGTLLFLPSCGPNTGTNVKHVAIDTAACSIGKVPTDAAPLLTDLVKSLTGSADAWGNATSVAIAAGVDVASCLFSAVEHALANQPPAMVAPIALAMRADRMAVFKAQITKLKTAVKEQQRFYRLAAADLH